MSTLFNFLNDSIFRKETPTEHECQKSGCDGKRLHGIKVNCHRCRHDYFLDCLAARSETIALLGQMNYNDKNGEKQPERANSKLNRIFYNDSVFEFVCPPCKFHNKQKTEQSMKIEENSVTILAQTKLIGELQGRVSSLELVIGDIKQMLEVQLLNDNSLVSSLKQCVLDVNKSKQTFEDAMKSLENIGSSPSQSDKLNVKADIHRDADSIELANEETVDLTRNTQSDHRSRPIEKTGHLIPTDNHPITQKQQLRPPKPVMAKNTNKPNVSGNTQLYEIFVSKFDVDITNDAIVTHIIDNTSLEDNSHFNVEKINFGKFAAFKVIALKKQVCDLILDERIWAPEYKAALFNHSSSKKMVNRYQQSNRITSNNQCRNADNNNKNVNKKFNRISAKSMNAPSRNAKKQTTTRTEIGAPNTNQPLNSGMSSQQQTQSVPVVYPVYQPHQNFFNGLNGFHQPQYRPMYPMQSMISPYQPQWSSPSY